jgi:transcriptional regulator with XRE-family HTH domain
VNELRTGGPDVRPGHSRRRPWIGPAGFRLLRAGQRLTQLQLAERAGVSKEAIHTYESGRKAPHPRTLVLLAAALGVPSSTLANPPPELRLSA